MVVFREAEDVAIDFGDVAIDVFHSTMDCIVRGVYWVEDLETWFADETGNAIFFEETLDAHTVDLFGKSVFGYIS